MQVQLHMNNENARNINRGIDTTVYITFFCTSTGSASITRDYDFAWFVLHAFNYMKVQYVYK